MILPRQFAELMSIEILLKNLSFTFQAFPRFLFIFISFPSTQQMSLKFPCLFICLTMKNKHNEKQHEQNGRNLERDLK
jgi:hypothetical protein